MKISTKGRYGMRAMVELTLLQGSGPVLLADIARNQGVSRKYLEQIFSNLRKAGLVRGVRGASGGYELACDPKDILLGDIVRALEGPIEPVDCLTGKNRCSLSGRCATQDVWRHMGEAVSSVLDAQTLEALARDQSQRNEKGASLMYHI